MVETQSCIGLRAILWYLTLLQKADNRIYQWYLVEKKVVMYVVVRMFESGERAPMMLD